MVTLAERLVRIPQRETAGARSSNRFAYQRSWALCRLLDLHESGNDYLLLAEFHEDIAVLDSPTSPSAIEFIQVKTQKNGRHWTRGQLLARKKGKSKERLPSILGKLYSNYLTFADHTSKLVLASNSPCKLKKGDGSTCDDQSSTCLDEIGEADLEHIREKLKEEHQLGDFPGGESLTFLEVSDLSVLGHDTGSLGRVTEFLDRCFQTTPIRPVPFHRTLKSEIERRCSREEAAKSLRDLVKRHGISRDDFASMINAAAATGPSERLADRIENRLNTEGASLPETVALVSAVNRYIVGRLNPTDTLLREAGACAQTALAAARGQSLTALLDEVRPAEGDALWRVEQLHGIHFRKAIVAVMLHEDQSSDHKLSPTHSEDEDEGA